MPHNSFYICKLEPSKLTFLDKNFEQVDSRELNGLFAYVLYKDVNLIMIGRLKDNYASYHAGINLIQKGLKEQLRKRVDNPQNICFSSHDPDSGGEILLLDGKVVVWNFKSQYSQPHQELHDDSPNLKQQVCEAGFPPERFINIKETEAFEVTNLRTYFSPDGQYKEKPQETADLICAMFDLPKQQSPVSASPLKAKYKDAFTEVTPSSCGASFFRRNSKSNPALSVALSPGPHSFR
ncbi:Uncharacterised protein [Legionella beliardensis]|uniref:Uncharacterized protein n=1 Tax=Legionella beliardensis TaxID=91822 RepID=A0A378I0E2_9GAMM|nr:hypothetical protein [Legionella beliardensis]STX28221.1 Uncharacterised protein [Legionella beliardensis]